MNYNLDIGYIKHIFELYGYLLQQETDSYLVYAAQHTMYPAVEIIRFPSANDQDIERIKTDYSSQCYAVRICDVRTSIDIEEYLFNWFFQVKSANKSIELIYKEYTDAVVKSYGVDPKDSRPYQYIDIPYTKEIDLEEEKQGALGDLIPSLSKNIAAKGPSLIIVEAAAGYGKTSTAMELLHTFSKIDSGIRPLYMELAKDRMASTFYYLLLSQIHKSFDVLLGDDIVYYNIKQGRIPLILDGFDELLSEDLDKGNIDKATRKGNSMLSTIAELLTGNAKIILTSRRTAILSGQEFVDWYYRNFTLDNQVRIIRYRLGLPMAESWLDNSRLKLLDDKLTDINNPVLLGYLSYLSDEEFAKECKSSLIVERYIDKLLERENSRQALSMTVDEQMLVFERLASAFAYSNITSEFRSNVKDDILLLSGDIIGKHESIQKDASNIANALTNHALLDRKPDNKVGFINDFVLGIMLGNAMNRFEDNSMSDFYSGMSDSFADKVITAFSLCSKTKRDYVWMEIRQKCKLVHPETLLKSDFLLMGQSMADYERDYFDGYKLSGKQIGASGSSFQSCQFVNFVFDSCNIDFSNIKDCVFINCHFNNTNIKGDYSECEFYTCLLDGDIFMSSLEEGDEEFQYVDNSEDNAVTQLLGQYFQVGNNGRRMQLISHLRSKAEDPKAFKKLFAFLVHKHYIVANGDKSHITSAGIEFYLSSKAAR